MCEKIICAGFGGQGIMLMGKVLAYAALFEGKKVTWMPSYGAETRGGTAYSMVTISDREIPSPIITEPTTCFVMNGPSFDKFYPNLRKGGLLIINSNLVKRRPGRLDIQIVEFPFTEQASRLGDVRVANMFALGAFIGKKRILLTSSVLRAMEEAFSDKKKLASLNKAAFKKGMSLVRC
jgi:2-oxoglutarate ferredoxin oxidoreductase subunit gamma